MARGSQTDEEMALMAQMTGQISEHDKKLIAVFSMEPVELSEESKEALRAKDPEKYPESIMGRPFYQEQEFITIYIPGDKDNVVFRPIRAVDRVRFPERYRAFKEKQTVPETGTMLSALPFLSKTDVRNFEALGVRTAEQLMNISDVNGQQIMGWADVKRRVQKFLNAASGEASNQKLESELGKRDTEINSLKAMLAEQAKKIGELTKSKG